MANSTISRDIVDLVKKQVDREVKRSIEAIIKARIESERNYFKETERLLYNYPALKLKLAQDEEDLANGLLVPKERSKDIVCPTGSSSYGPHDPLAQAERYIAERKASMERTKHEIRRIDRALETIQDDPYYDIIPLKYWDLLPPAEIAEALHCDERTFYRHKNRLVNKLKVVLFGADAL